MSGHIKTTESQAKKREDALLAGAMRLVRQIHTAWAKSVLEQDKRVDMASAEVFHAEQNVQRQHKPNPPFTPRAMLAYGFNPDKIAEEAIKNKECPYVALGRWATKAREAAKNDPNLPPIILTKKNMKQALEEVALSCVRLNPEEETKQNLSESEIRSKTGFKGWIGSKSDQNKSAREILAERKIRVLSEDKKTGLELKPLPPRELEDIFPAPTYTISQRLAGDALPTGDPQVWAALKRIPAEVRKMVELACLEKERALITVMIQVGVVNRETAIELARSVRVTEPGVKSNLHGGVLRKKIGEELEKILADPTPKEKELLKAYRGSLEVKGWIEATEPEKTCPPMDEDGMVPF